jgi:cysteine synthase
MEPQHLSPYDSVLDTIGWTPLIRLGRLGVGIRTPVFAKAEHKNPGGSVKDRIGLAIIEDAEARGTLRPGGTIVEATSGNTGIALAAMATLMGHPMTATVPFSMPEEKAVLLEALGARLVRTPADAPATRHPMDVAFDMASEMTASSDEYVMPDQYDNPDNVRSHYESTGPEIWDQTEGAVRYFFAGVGTCGTVTGVGRFLKEQDPSIRVVAIEPVPGHKISGLKNLEETCVPGIYDRSVIDEVVYVDDAEARAMALRLHREEALLVGSSGAAIIAGALRYLDGKAPGIAVAIAPDSSQKAISYLAAAMGR